MYEAPKITDYGAITDHTFTNNDLVPGVGPDGKNRVYTDLVEDKFGEPSHS